jgi:DMSO/TMAO reductase YedYZ molybdopterin-dependent catalytic subunit
MTHRFYKLLAAALVFALAAAAPACAEDAAPLAISGLVAHELKLTAADLAAMPASEVHVAYQTSHGPEEATFTGVPVWDLIEKAGFAEALQNPKQRLTHYLLARAADGYEVLIALAEIDPGLEGKSVLIAVTQDGKPIAPKDGFRIVMPGDKRGARHVHQLLELQVK